jgi:hypothetical protein
VPLPLLFEVGTTSSAFVLCMFHGPQYVSSAASLPGGVKLPVTKSPDFWIYWIYRDLKCGTFCGTLSTGRLGTNKMKHFVKSPTGMRETLFETFMKR